MTTSSASANELANIEKVQGGYFLTDENIISLANYIQELQDDNARLAAQVDALNQALQDERIFADKLFAEKDKLINLQAEQIKDLKFVYEHNKPTVLDKGNLLLGGAGVAAILIFLAQTL